MVSDGQSTGVKPRVRPLKTLRAYFNRSAPKLSVSGRRQSRRLEGQLSGDLDRTCYSEVVMAVPVGVAQPSSELRSVCKAITAFQRDAERGAYDLRLVVYGAAEAVLGTIHLGYKSTANSVMRWLQDNAPKVPVCGGQRLDELPRLDRGALLVIVQVHDDDTVAAAVVDQIAKHPDKQVALVQLRDNIFYTGTGISRRDVLMGKASAGQAAVIGYSERGMVNALVAFLRQDNGRVAHFLKACVWPDSSDSLASAAHPPDGRVLMRALEDPVVGEAEVTYIVEAGFAQFGDPDLIIVIEANETRWVFFVEAKIVSYAHSAKPNVQGMPLPGFNSTINGQLSLRYRLARALAAYGKPSQVPRPPLAEPGPLHKVAKEKHPEGLEDPYHKRVRHLSKQSNLQHLVPRLLPSSSQAEPAEFLSQVYLVALTHEAEAPHETWPRKCNAATAPHYFHTEGSTHADRAWRHTGFCSWGRLAKQVVGLAEDPDYLAVQKMLSKPTIPTPGARGGPTTLTSRPWSGYAGSPWVEETRSTVHGYFRDAWGALGLGCNADLRKLVGSDSWAAGGLVVAKVMPQGQGAETKVLVGLACGGTYVVPPEFPEDVMIGEQTIKGRWFRFASLDEHATLDTHDALRRVVEEFVGDLGLAG